jgi:hypothetical protein
MYGAKKLQCLCGNDNFLQMKEPTTQAALQSLVPWHFLHDFALLSQTFNRQLLAKCVVTRQNSAVA